jgi:hypothetical protein
VDPRAGLDDVEKRKFNDGVSEFPKWKSIPPQHIPDERDGDISQTLEIHFVLRWLTASEDFIAIVTHRYELLQVSSDKMLEKNISF